MEYLLGIEIGGKVIRSAAITTDSKKIQAYAEFTRESHTFGQEPQFEELEQAFRYLFETLPEKYVQNARIAVAFGSKHSGVKQISANDPWFGALEIRLSSPISRLEYNGATMFAPKRLIRNINKAAQTAGGTIEVLELSPLVALNVLPKDFTGSFTLRSGSTWTATVTNGTLQEATESKPDYREHKMTIETGKQSQPLDSLGPITVNPALLETYDLEINDLAVVAAAALSAEPEDNIADVEIISEATPPLPDAATYANMWGEQPPTQNSNTKAFLVTFSAFIFAALVLALGYYFIVS